MLLEDKIVWVAGPAEPSTAVAHAFAAEGARVVILGSNRESSIANVIDEAAGVDALVTIPQLGPASAFLDIPAEAFARAMETDFSQPALLMRAILPGMTQRGAGAIVNVVAAGALRGLPGSAACAAAGAALLNLSRSVGEEIKRTGVRINCLAVGPVDSAPFTASPAFTYELAQGNDATPLTTLANSALFLASDMSAGVNCQVVTARGANRW